MFYLSSTTPHQPVVFKHSNKTFKLSLSILSVKPDYLFHISQDLYLNGKINHSSSSISSYHPYRPTLHTPPYYSPSEYDSDSEPGTPVMTPTSTHFSDQPPSYEEAQRALDPSSIPTPTLLQVNRLVISDEPMPMFPPEYTTASSSRINVKQSTSGPSNIPITFNSSNEKSREHHPEADLANQPVFTQPTHTRTLSQQAQDLGTYFEKLGAEFSKRSEAFGDSVSLAARTWADDVEKRLHPNSGLSSPSVQQGPFARGGFSERFWPREETMEAMVASRGGVGFSHPGRCPRGPGGGFGNRGIGHPGRRRGCDGMGPRDQVNALRDQIQHERDLTRTGLRAQKANVKEAKREMKWEAKGSKRELKYDLKALKREIKAEAKERKREWKA